MRDVFSKFGVVRSTQLREL